MKRKEVCYRTALRWQIRFQAVPCYSLFFGIPCLHAAEWSHRFKANDRCAVTFISRKLFCFVNYIPRRQLCHAHRGWQQALGRQTKRTDKQYTKHNVSSTSDEQHTATAVTVAPQGEWRHIIRHDYMYYKVHTALLEGRRLHSWLLTTKAMYEYRSTAARSPNVYTPSTTLIPFQSNVAGENKTSSELL